MPRRVPTGDTGVRHETVGSDILAVYRVLQFPEMVLGEARARELAAVDPQRWYPIADLFDLVDGLAAKAGDSGLRTIGRTLMQLTHGDHGRRMHSVREFLCGMDGMYHAANRGAGIGGWQVTRFTPGEAELDKTTAHHCVLEEGVLDAGLKLSGLTCHVEQIACLREGAPHCVYRVSSRVVDERWG